MAIFPKNGSNNYVDTHTDISSSITPIVVTEVFTAPRTFGLTYVISKETLDKIFAEILLPINATFGVSDYDNFYKLNLNNYNTIVSAISAITTADPTKAQINSILFYKEILHFSNFLNSYFNPLIVSDVNLTKMSKSDTLYILAVDLVNSIYIESEVTDFTNYIGELKSVDLTLDTNESNKFKLDINKIKDNYTANFYYGGFYYPVQYILSTTAYSLDTKKNSYIGYCTANSFDFWYNRDYRPDLIDDTPPPPPPPVFTEKRKADVVIDGKETKEAVIETKDKKVISKNVAPRMIVAPNFVDLPYTAIIQINKDCYADVVSTCNTLNAGDTATVSQHYNGIPTRSNIASEDSVSDYLTFYEPHINMAHTLSYYCGTKVMNVNPLDATTSYPYNDLQETATLPTVPVTTQFIKLVIDVTYLDLLIKEDASYNGTVIQRFSKTDIDHDLYKNDTDSILNQVIKGDALRLSILCNEYLEYLFSSLIKNKVGKVTKAMIAERFKIGKSLTLVILRQFFWDNANYGVTLTTNFPKTVEELNNFYTVQVISNVRQGVLYIPQCFTIENENGVDHLAFSFTTENV